MLEDLSSLRQEKLRLREEKLLLRKERLLLKEERFEKLMQLSELDKELSRLQNGRGSDPDSQEDQPKGRNEQARRALERGIDLTDVITSFASGLADEAHTGDVNDLGIAKPILQRHAPALRSEGNGLDGTTTATVLADAMAKAGLRNVAAGANAITLQRGIDKAADFLVSKIKEHAQPISDSNAIAQVGTIFAGNDEEVGRMIADAMDKVGKEGVIYLEEGNSMTTEL